jgi:nitrate/nitrite transporter NarK
MRSILKTVSLLSLIVLVLPSVLFLAGRVSLDAVKWIMLVATVVWFITAAGWMWKDPQEPAKDEVVVP